MSRPSLAPVFTGLRWGLHALVAALTLLVVARAVLTLERPSAAVVLAAVFASTYAVGAVTARPGRRGAARVWLGVLVLQWVGLLWLEPDAAYLAFPLFFLVLHLLRGWAGVAAVVGTAAVTVLAIGVHGGWTVGGVVGPLVGAGVALLLGLGYASLAREALARERLLAELLSTRDRLAESQHEAGVLAERARLARDIHDTVAQSLSSIQMLLHAAERADGDRPGVEHLRLARETAASSLADTRRMIRALTPEPLESRGLPGAVERLAETQWRPTGLEVKVRIADGHGLPMHLQTALLRIVQAAMANVVQHADASTAVIDLTQHPGAVRLTVSDDGRGFDPEAVAGAAARGSSDSFGLRATRERAEALGGTVRVQSRRRGEAAPAGGADPPASGTTMIVELSTPEESSTR